MIRVLRIERREPVGMPPRPRSEQRRPGGGRPGRVTIALGLGDVVDRVAKPIARWVDGQTRRLPRRYRTRLAGCSACSRRRRWLNLLVPDVRRPELWWSAWRRTLGGWRAAFRPAARPLQGSGRTGAPTP